MSVLKILSDERIVDVELSEDKRAVIITERCDGYYDYKLSRNQVNELITELTELFKQMEPTP